MNASVEFESILSMVADAQTIDGLRAAIGDIRDGYRLANIAFHAVSIPAASKPNPILLLTYDDSWVSRYVARDYFAIDPVVRFGIRGFLPLDWGEVDRSSSDAQQFFREADSFGVGRQGVTLPVRGPAGERSLFTITSHDTDADWARKRIAYIREFQVIAHYVHNRAMELSGYRPGLAADLLSGRERECLRLIVAGMHPKQIAARLGISASAVQLYLQSARTKLGCASLTEAAVKAAKLEIIGP